MAFSFVRESPKRHFVPAPKVTSPTIGLSIEDWYATRAANDMANVLRETKIQSHQSLDVSAGG